jgi:hypothetical protein
MIKRNKERKKVSNFMTKMEINIKEHTKEQTLKVKNLNYMINTEIN